MRVGWLSGNTTPRWVVGKKTRRNPYPEPSMTLIPCEMREEKNTFLYRMDELHNIETPICTHQEGIEKK